MREREAKVMALLEAGAQSKAARIGTLSGELASKMMNGEHLSSSGQG